MPGAGRDRGRGRRRRRSSRGTCAPTCPPIACIATAGSFRGAHTTSRTCGATTWSPSWSAAASPSRPRFSRPGSLCGASRPVPTCLCTARTGSAGRRAPCPGRSWCRCDRSRRARWPTPSASPRGIRQCTARRCTWASPAALGIDDLAAPDFGDPVEVRDGEIPVFWACGVTPQAAVMRSRPSFAIGHAPGHMAITDARDSAYAVP